MSDIMWNPWHGCKKISEGCQNCYMYYLDAQRERDGGDIYKVKNNFNLPLKKDRHGNFKVVSGDTIRVCMTSDFFLEEADEWRNDVWDMIRKRRDVNFWLLTKRACRIEKHLPNDWGEGWDNVYLNVTAENQIRADERIPILLSLPAKHKGVMVAPFIGEINIERYLLTRQIDYILADGENYEGARPLHYEWIKFLFEQCKRQNVPMKFFGTGDIFIKDGREYRICKAYQRVQAERSGFNYPQIGSLPEIQKRCAECKRRFVCNGCKWCGKCV